MNMLRARTWRLVELIAVLLIGAAAFELGMGVKLILIGFVLTALVTAVALLLITLLERRTKARDKRTP